MKNRDKPIRRWEGCLKKFTWNGLQKSSQIVNETWKLKIRISVSRKNGRLERIRMTVDQIYIHILQDVDVDFIFSLEYILYAFRAFSTHSEVFAKSLLGVLKSN